MTSADFQYILGYQLAFLYFALWAAESAVEGIANVSTTTPCASSFLGFVWFRNDRKGKSNVSGQAFAGLEEKTDVLSFRRIGCVGQPPEQLRVLYQTD